MGVKEVRSAWAFKVSLWLLKMVFKMEHFAQRDNWHRIAGWFVIGAYQRWVPFKVVSSAGYNAMQSQRAETLQVLLYTPE